MARVKTKRATCFAASDMPDARKCGGGDWGGRVRLHEPQFAVAERRRREAEAAAAPGGGGPNVLAVLGGRGRRRHRRLGRVVVVVGLVVVVQQVLLVNVEARGREVGRLAHDEETTTNTNTLASLLTLIPTKLTYTILRTEQRPDLRRRAGARALRGQDDHGHGR